MLYKTDSLDGDPVLRSLKGNEVIRPASANRNTADALAERGLLSRLRVTTRLRFRGARSRAEGVITTAK